MDDKTTVTNTVPSDRYHEFVPATASLITGKDYWDGLSLNIYHYSAADNEGIMTPSIPDYAIAFILSGNGEGNCHFGSYKWEKHCLQPGIATLVEKYNPVCWQWRADKIEQGGETINLMLSDDFISRTCESALGIDKRKIQISSIGSFQDELMLQMALELRREAEQKSPFGKLFGETAAQLLAIHLLRKYSTIQPKLPVFRGGLPKKVLQIVTDYIHDHLNRDISLESLSILASLSSYHFARQFKQSTGLAPHQYVVQCRIEKAKELLKHTNLSITQIALEIGYESQSHFTSLFKRLVGVTPKSYRDKV